MFSLQSSIPPTIRQSDCDCDMPRNLRDIDFDENSTELPPPRDLSEPTEISYIMTKYRRVLVLAEVNTLAESGKATDFVQVEKYRKVLEELYESTPSHLKIATPEEIQRNPGWKTQQQTGIDRLYQHTRCILYRKFLAPAHREPTPQLLEYRHSCIDAAMTLLSHQVILYEEYNGYQRRSKNDIFPT